MDRSPDLVDVLRAEGGGTPLFLIHAMGGMTGCYRALTARLAPGRPVYAFKAPRLGHRLYPLATVEAMAAVYARTAAQIAGARSLHLAGWSMGGLIAFEMARMLRAGGREVGGVVLIDTWMREEHLAAVWPAAHRRELAQRRWRVFIKLATGAVDLLDDDEHAFWSWDEPRRMEFVLDCSRRLNPDRYGDKDAGEQLAADYRAYMVLRGASDGYRPAPWDGEVTWIGAEASPDLESAAVWAGLARTQSGLVMTPGDHLTLIEEPHVARLAAALDQAMGEDGSRYSPNLAAR
jgi:thioesterase domain-containing protein